ncbi:HpcH/HpaI aldolase/citrate lyase family protein [Qipengyuania atrilutea]|nr:CoA ester lyase [Actirhodobacter atriluteus]
MLLRSALYVPASNSRALQKAPTLDCDSVILDLEDAVAPSAKVSAREAALEFAGSGALGERMLVIRANALDTPWGRDDIPAIAYSGAHGVLVPKINSASDVEEVDKLLEGAPPEFAMWAMIETCAAIMALAEIAAAARSSRLSGFVSGTNDLLKEMRAAPMPGRPNLIAMLALTVAAGRASGLTVLDGVYNDFGDHAGFAAECRQGRDFGFDGKTLIHPGQITAANECYGPSTEQLADARNIVAAFARSENAEAGVIEVDGKMVERLHLSIAEETIARAERIHERERQTSGS